MTIAETLKKLRLEKGMSQSEVCKAMNITQQRLSNWETGKALPQSDTFLKLARLYDVKDVLEEFGFKDVEGGVIHPTYFELELIRKLRKLDSTFRDSIMQIVDYCFQLNEEKEKEEERLNTKKPNLEVSSSQKQSKEKSKEPKKIYLAAAHGITEDITDEEMELVKQDIERVLELDQEDSEEEI